jgi:hypothetical protein
MHILVKCTVQEAKSPVKKNLIRQCCGNGFNSGVKGLSAYYALELDKSYILLKVSCRSY